jgi:hypothetical protein
MQIHHKITLQAVVLVAFLVLSGLSGAVAQRFERDISLSWNRVQADSADGYGPVVSMSFSGSGTRFGYGLLPFINVSWPVTGENDSVAGVQITNEVYEPVPMTRAIPGLEKVSGEPLLFSTISVRRKLLFAEVAVLPIRKNGLTGQFERLISFSLAGETVARTERSRVRSSASAAAHSVLAAGRWYKFATATAGVYRITYDDMNKLGIPVGSVNPQNLRIYGNGGGMLPEANATPRADDLTENSIFVYSSSATKFGPGDYILFYGQSPDVWTYSKTDHVFRHRKNLFSDRAYYFLTFDMGPGKRITSEASSGQPATHFISKFDDYAFYEKDDKNLIKSGREWFDGEYFDITTSRNYSFVFPNIDLVKPVQITVDAAARSTSGSTNFRLMIGSEQVIAITIPPTGTNYLDTYAIERQGSAGYAATGDVIDMKLIYNKPYSNCTGYLNWIEVNAARLLKMSGTQMAFRSLLGAGKDRISEFTLGTVGQNLQVWDISSAADIRQIQTTASGADLKFRLPTDTIREFIAFDGSSFYAPEFIGQVENQDLHGTPVVDYIIVSHPSFVDEARRLAAFHGEYAGLSTFVTTPEKIYNEFSSGSQDITAIRDFARMMYNRAEPGKEPKYLLLFGDASYDYRNRLPDNTNYVPSFQSVESLDPIDSYVTDDYFVILDQNEGQGASGDLDMGVGRFAVMTAGEARASVDKVVHYCSNSDAVKNDWRNVVCFVADDQDEGGNIFINDSENLGDIIENGYKDYNLDKIYVDAYTQVSTPGGKRYPEVNDAINKRVEKGALIINYVGHGGEVGWGHERVLEVPDIRNWRNFDNMPVFMTATCEFSRFDDPERISAGEWVFLNGEGGGIALFTTTRATFAGSNFVLSNNFYQHAFTMPGGEYLKMGDLIMLSKAGSGSNANTRKFVLLGDPALKMNYPDLDVVTTEINSQVPTTVPDTIKALMEITIKGEVRDLTGNKAQDFTGTVFPTVYDKASEVWTKGNDGSPQVKFYLRKNPVYKGKAAVVNGSFEFSFIVPKDIAYNYGVGKISYYARSNETDANGYSDDIVVGGYNNEAPFDDRGPEISLFINTRNFVSGGITDQDPKILADISDESGINTVGNGIGHDITAVLDDRTSEPLILNDYYVTDLNTFTSGTLGYPLSKLAEGAHHLVLKVWDVYNNSSEAGIDFVVVSSSEFAYEHLYNYPNPMRDHTTFSFETNQVYENLEVEIQIFTIYGRLIKTFRRSLYTSGYRIEPITWDGTTDAGSKVDSGTYVYRVLVTSADGNTHQQTSKLVVIR